MRKVIVIIAALAFVSCQNSRLVRATLISQRVYTVYPPVYEHVYKTETGQLIYKTTPEPRNLLIGHCYRINPKR